MKVVAFNGSPRKNGNTAILISHIFQELKREGIKTELIQLSKKKIHGCIACYRCFKNKDRRCAVQDDSANEYIEKMVEADGIILASPVYFWDITPELKALIDRAGFVSLANGGMYINKVGAGVVALRRAGAVHALDSINHFFLGAQMILVGRCIGVGRDKGDVEKDEEGIQTAALLARRIAWALKKIHC